MARYRVGIIGCGNIALAHAHGWLNCEQTDLVALADISPEALEGFGEAFGVAPEHSYGDFREMLDRERLDIVSVCLWHGQHAEGVVAAAARRPKLILCEKPMATSLGEAEQMIVAARRNGVKLAIGHQRRFLPGWETARRLVAEGAIGQPRHLWATIGDGLMNIGTHTIDMMRFVMGDPAAVAVTGAVQRATDRYERAMRIEDSCAGVIEFDNGARALVESDLTPSIPVAVNCVFYGSEGSLEIREDYVRLMRGGNGWQDLAGAPHVPTPPEAYDTRAYGADAWYHMGGRRGPEHLRAIKASSVAQANELIDWLEGRVEDYRGEARQGYAVLEIMMALYESARLREVTRLPLATRTHPLDLMVESGALPVTRPGKYDIRSFLVRGEGMSWL